MIFSTIFKYRPLMAILPFILTGIIFFLIPWACNNRPTDRNIESSVQGVLKSHSGCKSNERSLLSELDATHECILYSYDGQDTLFLTHYNAAFNCCPNSIKGIVSIDGGEITITETETYGDPPQACHCFCLYDLEYIVTGIMPGNYKLKIDAPYYSDSDAPFEFDLDLTDQTFAPVQKCLLRDHYPWETITEQPVNISRLSQCGGFDADSPAIPFPTTAEECLIYSYDGHGLITILHEGIHFNCCLAGMAVRTEIMGNDLYIYEEEVLEDGGCDCICDYDMEYKISDLELPYYNIRISGGYRLAPQFPPLFEFMLVTTAPVSDTLCLPR